MIRPSLLLIEDEPALAEMLAYNLEEAGFEVARAEDGETGLTLLAARRFDLLLVDWMLPGVSGLEICRQVRRGPDTADLPVIMLTARGEEGDKLRGLEIGADDYITKPFSPAEVIARIRTVLRRTRPASAADALAFANIHMDLAGHRVARGTRDVHLGPTEFRLLRHFLENPGRVYTRDQLLDRVWGHDVYLETRTVDVHIRRLRKALNAAGEADLLRTVRGTGYALDHSAST